VSALNQQRTDSGPHLTRMQQAYLHGPE
jgi:hypothetical protein